MKLTKLMRDAKEIHDQQANFYMSIFEGLKDYLCGTIKETEFLDNVCEDIGCDNAAKKRMKSYLSEHSELVENADNLTRYNVKQMSQDLFNLALIEQPDYSDIDTEYEEMKVKKTGDNWR